MSVMAFTARGNVFGEFRRRDWTSRGRTLIACSLAYTRLPHTRIPAVDKKTPPAPLKTHKNLPVLANSINGLPHLLFKIRTLKKHARPRGNYPHCRHTLYTISDTLTTPHHAHGYARITSRGLFCSPKAVARFHMLSMSAKSTCA